MMDIIIFKHLLCDQSTLPQDAAKDSSEHDGAYPPLSTIGSVHEYTIVAESAYTSKEKNLLIQWLIQLDKRKLSAKRYGTLTKEWNTALANQPQNFFWLKNSFCCPRM